MSDRNLYRVSVTPPGDRADEYYVIGSCLGDVAFYVAQVIGKTENESMQIALTATDENVTVLPLGGDE